MRPKEHANLLSIFFWIFAGLQTLMFLLILFYAGFMGVAAVMVAQEGKKGSEQATILLIVIIAILVVLLLFGLTSIIVNIMAGHGLRNGKAWTRRWVLIASILSILSFLCGGIMIMPFGIALGVYGLVFVFGEAGKYYFAENNLSPTNQIRANRYSPYPPNNWQ